MNATEPVMAYAMEGDGPVAELVCPACFADGLSEYYSPEQIAGAKALTWETYPWDERAGHCGLCVEPLEPEIPEGW
jgi:hypothetical protein